MSKSKSDIVLLNSKLYLIFEEYYRFTPSTYKILKSISINNEISVLSQYKYYNLKINIDNPFNKADGSDSHTARYFIYLLGEYKDVITQKVYPFESLFWVNHYIAFNTDSVDVSPDSWGVNTVHKLILSGKDTLITTTR